MTADVCYDLVNVCQPLPGRKSPVICVIYQRLVLTTYNKTLQPAAPLGFMAVSWAEFYLSKRYCSLKILTSEVKPKEHALSGCEPLIEF
jgi:hypothetical protein